jgi:hypothetical protein
VQKVLRDKSAPVSPDTTEPAAAAPEPSRPAFDLDRLKRIRNQLAAALDA